MTSVQRPSAFALPQPRGNASDQLSLQIRLACRERVLALCFADEVGGADLSLGEGTRQSRERQPRPDEHRSEDGDDDAVHLRSGRCYSSSPVPVIYYFAGM